ncbi:MAG: DEAD/DEAH box helicase [Alphaproteobacteria bacterium]|nr:DEAD/DEAH box helicase [Alphaproteobacteria bacterium]
MATCTRCRRLHLDIRRNIITFAETDPRVARRLPKACHPGRLSKQSPLAPVARGRRSTAPRRFTRAFRSRSLVHKEQGIRVNDITFSQLGLSEPLCRALAAEDYTYPTPIQAQAIPRLLDGRDLLGIAQTGTGKTAAFALPILQKLSKPQLPVGARSAHALILAPTRELAIQIGESFRIYGKHTGLRHTVILGGVGQPQQVKAMARGVDILIATPGRLLDLVQQKHVRLQDVKHFVLDEADRMLDMGFIRDVRKIVTMLPRHRQSLLFSATMPNGVAKLAAEMLCDPLRVEVTPQAVTVDRVDQHVHFVETAQKRALLTDLLKDTKLARVIVFTRTKHHANRVSEHLERAGVSNDALHGNKSQNARQRALQRFRSGEARVLVATDIAARGIDVDGVTHVINFELPNEPESYVHRIGRTARAGNAGTAIAFCDASERGFLRDIEKLTRQPLTVVGARPAAHDTPQAKREARRPDPSVYRRRRQWHRGRQRRAA